ncbi:MAG: class I SAM-dependent methyltransferase [Calditrichaeota bacterium]|nr:class I SAM-dependent methyltransferase [Calditrichota bacterium]
MSLNAEVDPKGRFSSRTPFYHAARPRYPLAMQDFLKAELGLGPGSMVADVGSGSGLSCEPFLALGCRVWAVEPNPEMRREAERHYRVLSWTSVDGSAEATTLASGQFDCAAAGQAFHWFDADRARIEFARILKPSGSTVIFWNRRIREGGFNEAYEEIIVRFRRGMEALDDFFRYQGRLNAFFSGRFETRSLQNHQDLNREGLMARILSASYMPLPYDPDYHDLLKAVDTAFARFERSGKVRIDYNTDVHYGRPAA